MSLVRLAHLRLVCLPTFAHVQGHPQPSHTFSQYGTGCISCLPDASEVDVLKPTRALVTMIQLCEEETRVRVECSV